MTGIPDDETISFVVQRPGDDEAVRIAEASVGDIRSALKRAREAALAGAGPGEREQVEGLWAITGSSSPPASPTSALARKRSRRSRANCHSKPFTNAKGRVRSNRICRRQLGMAQRLPAWTARQR